MPALLETLNGHISMMDGTQLPRIQSKAFDLDDETDFADFARGAAVKIQVPGTDLYMDYDPMKRIGVQVSTFGASHSIAMGAYVYALHHLNN